MQVKQRLRINAVVTAVSVLAILAVLFMTAHRVVKAVEANNIADTIITAAFEKLALKTDYLRTGSERAREQVTAKNSQISDLLKSASEKFTGPEDEKTVAALIEGNESIGKIFSAIVANRENEGPKGRSEDLSQEIEGRLISQLNMRVYETVLLGGKLQASSNAALFSALRLAGGGIMFVFLLAGVATLINSATMSRAITDRIEKLRDGALVIGGGNLDHRIEIKGDDEFSELAESFNAMTVKLSATYHDVENEVAERKRAEESLRKAHDELEVRVEERTKEIKELNEGLEYRIAERTAELRSANETLRASRAAALNLMEDALDASKQAEESELFYRRTLESIPGMVFTTRPDGYCDYQSQQWVDFTGVPMSEHLGDGWNKLLHPDDRPKAFAAWRAAVEGRAPYDLEYRVRRHDGRYEWFKVLGRPIRDAAGRIVRWFGVAANIDVIKQGEESLRQSEQRLERAQEISHLGSWELDLVNNVLAWSDETYRIFGLQPQEFSATYEAFIEAVHPDDRDAVSAAYATSIREGKDTYEIEHRVVRKSTGEIRIVHGKCDHVRDASGRTIRSVGMVHDITERRAAEEEIRELVDNLALRNAELSTVNKELESFVYSASHDLRAPLRHISAFADLVEKNYGERFDEKGMDYLVRIRASAVKMSGIIDDLLRLSRVSRQDIHLQKVDLSEIVTNIIAELRDADAGRNVEVVIQKRLTARADPRLMGVAFSNLLGNAWKYTSKTGKARIEFGASVQNGQTVYYVRDNGAGFDQRLADRMFLPFHRLHTASEFEGTGVGLAIVERVISRHRGQIWAEGEVGKGATIRFTLDCRA